MKREELKAGKAIDWTLTHDKYIYFYHKSEADSVMDAMEARIQHLEAILDLDPRTNLSLVNENQQLRDRIKELESKEKKWKNDAANCCALLHLVRKGKNPTSTEMIAEADRLEKLEAENERLKVELDFWREGDIIFEEHQKEIDALKSENERLKAQVPKWHSVADGDLPTRSDMFCVLFNTEDRRLIRSACYYFADGDGWEFNRVYKWCELPAEPPTTEESSAIETEN